MIVKKFANVELRCTYSPIGANIALLHFCITTMMFLSIGRAC